MKQSRQDCKLVNSCCYFMVARRVYFERDCFTPGIQPNGSGAATVSPDGKQVGKNFIRNKIIIIKVCYLLYSL